jgi:hypothetical protein
MTATDRSVDAPLTELVQIIETRRKVGSDPGFIGAWDRAEVAARLDALHAENQRLKRALDYSRAKEKQWRNKYDAILVQQREKDS